MAIPLDQAWLVPLQNLGNSRVPLIRRSHWKQFPSKIRWFQRGRGTKWNLLLQRLQSRPIAQWRRTMNCEEVFVILTRGPFPSGARSDAAVEAHLQICPDCQRLAAALRPNDRGLQETIESEDTRALPGYWGNLLGSSSDLAISLTDTVGFPRAQRLGVSSRQQLSRGKNLNIGQFAAAVALGIVLAAALRTLVTVHAPLPGGRDPGMGMLIQGPVGQEPSHSAASAGEFWFGFLSGKNSDPARPAFVGWKVADSTERLAGRLESRVLHAMSSLARNADIVGGNDQFSTTLHRVSRSSALTVIRARSGCSICCKVNNRQLRPFS
jgi:hypothetical protein